MTNGAPMEHDEDPLDGIDPATIVWGAAHLTATASGEPAEPEPEPAPE